MNLEKEIENYKQIISKELTSSRLEHSLRVAELAEKFALAHNYPHPKKAYLAGVLHDITKQKKREFHIAIFEKNHFDYSNIPENAFHPFSAKFYLQEQYHFQDTEVLSAIQNHTLGGENLSLLDAILYASDFLGSEYAIKQKEYKDWISKVEKNIYFGVYLKAKITILELLEKNEKIHPNTISTYNSAVTKLD